MGVDSSEIVRSMEVSTICFINAHTAFLHCTEELEDMYCRMPHKLANEGDTSSPMLKMSKHLHKRYVYTI